MAGSSCVNAAKLCCIGLRAWPVSCVCAMELRNGRKVEALRGSGRKSKAQDSEQLLGLM